MGSSIPGVSNGANSPVSSSSSATAKADQNVNVGGTTGPLFNFGNYVPPGSVAGIPQEDIVIIVAAGVILFGIGALILLRR